MPGFSAMLRNRRHVVHMDASWLSPGTYFYRLEVGERRLTRQMPLSR